MHDASICIFAWDFADEGIETVLEFVADCGLTSLYLASVYHAGWLVLPHNPKRTCFMPEDGVAYFHPTTEFFEGTPLKPQVARMAATTDWFAEIGSRLNTFNLKLTAWTVCNHNTRLGRAFPENTVRNALGDSYPHALTPASPAVRTYIRGLAVSLASQYPLQSIYLEAPGYQGRRHGHHHERVFTPFGELENELLDISFSEFDVACAEAAGVDGDSVRRPVVAHLRSFLADGPSRDRPATLEQFYREYPELSTYRAALENVARSLIAEIRQDVASFGIELEGEEPNADYDWHVVDAFHKTPEEVAEITRASRTRMAPYQRLRVGLQLGFDVRNASRAITTADRCRECVRAATENGADAILFYNYSESPRSYLSWIKPALQGLLGPRGHCLTAPDKEAN